MSYLVYIKQAVANLFKPPVTSQYPLKPKEFAPGVRGRVVNDVSQCILCGMCEKSCPAGALKVDRKTGQWKIDPFACVQCGACVSACPKKCLHMDPHYAAPGLAKSEIILEVVQKDGASTVKKQVSAVAPVAASQPMGDRSHIVNNVVKCIFCGQCERNCPADAITVDRRNRTWRINLEACVNCGTCIDNCPRKCLSLGCYLGNRTDITVKGVAPVRKAAPKPAAPAAAQTPAPAPEKVIIEVADTHIFNEIEKCLFCGKCERACPGEAISIDRRNRTWTIDRDKCMTCGVCVNECPAHSLSLRDAWEEGEKKEIKTTYQGKVLTRRPVVRPAPPKATPAPEAPKAAPKVEAPKAEPKAEAPKVEVVKAHLLHAEGPTSANPWHIENAIEKCLFCGQCERNCPVGAITLDRKNRTWSIDRDKCVSCGVCESKCPAHCLSLKEDWTEGDEKAVRVTWQAVKTLEAPKPAPKAEAPKADVVKAGLLHAEGPASVNPWHIENAIEKCLFCGQCERNCPVGAISIDRTRRTWSIDRDKCVSCGVCEGKCPAHCLSLKEEWGEGEEKAARITLQGTMNERQRAAAEKAKAPAEKSAPAPAPRETESTKESENPWHIKNAIDRCLFCGMCQRHCPMHAITVDRKTRTWQIDRDKCVSCGLCKDKCPAKCLTLEEEWGEGEDRAVKLTMKGEKKEK